MGRGWAAAATRHRTPAREYSAKRWTWPPDGTGYDLAIPDDLPPSVRWVTTDRVPARLPVDVNTL